MSASSVAYDVITGCMPGALVALVVIALVGLLGLWIGDLLARE